jgi:ATP-dependent Lon protease
MTGTALAEPRRALPIYVVNKIVYYPGLVGKLTAIDKYWVEFFDKLLKKGKKDFAVGYTLGFGSPTMGPVNIYDVATECKIISSQRVSDNEYQLMVKFTNRLRWRDWVDSTPYLVGIFKELDDIGNPQSIELKEWARALQEKAKNTLGSALSHAEFLHDLEKSDEVGLKADKLVFHLTEMSADDYKMAIEHLANSDLLARAENAAKLLAREVEKANINEKTARVFQEEQAAMQNRYILERKKQVIERELAEIERRKPKDRGRNPKPTVIIKTTEEKLADLAKAAEESRDERAAEAYKAAKREYDRLQQMNGASQEAEVCRTRLELILDLPWVAKTQDIEDIGFARKVLDEDHFGLEKIKKRILEFLAVRKISPKKRAPILCFIGPPGVGKTSIGKSVARCTGRKFIRIALGGVRDEAEIRGHRRTYIGALPGRIIQGMKKVGVKNPVFMLDEIDKLKVDHGDPASALLEALDPEQNYMFSDHNLEIPFDLSNVIFLCTANFWTIPPALLDRMEVIELSGYTRNEKLNIATGFLIPKQLDQHGFAKGEIEFLPEIIYALIDSYTRESGVRNLERTIADVIRCIAVRKVEGVPYNATVTAEDIVKYLGPSEYEFELAGEKDSIGISTGLYWSPTGGSIAIVETLAMPGRGKLILTGNLQDVIKESVIMASGYIRSHAAELGIDSKFFRKHDIHIHFPGGATPKDGPSAGLAITTALVSLATGKKVNRLVAMTGEMDLRGRTMVIGGLKEKLLGAHRAGIKTVLFPAGNKKDLVEVPDEIKNELELIAVKHVSEVLARALI